MNDPFPQPPLTSNHAGDERRVGIEIEFTNLPGTSIARIVKDALGGTVEWETDYEAVVRDTSLGSFIVELDWRWLKEQQRKRNGLSSKSPIADQTIDLIGIAAQQLVPWELVSPPIPLAKLHRLDELVALLHDSGAQGTRKSALYAFGVHFNPELPSLDAEVILAYLQAYACLHDWLVAHGEIDLTRRITSYIDGFERDYVALIIADDYTPNTQELIDNYLANNPTRNRSLDMLPLLAHLDEGRVRKVVDDARLNPRPTLHYRLPNCDIDRPGWRLEKPWRDWLQVEYLASDPERLRQARTQYRSNLERLLSPIDRAWAQECEQWLVDL
ncbi:MAG: amidoligase family protein [Arenicellales bacterium]